MTHQIAAQAKEQSHGTNEINNNICSLNSYSEKSAEGAVHVMTGSGELSQLAQRLNVMVGKFKV